MTFSPGPQWSRNLRIASFEDAEQAYIDYRAEMDDKNTRAITSMVRNRDRTITLVYQDIALITWTPEYIEVWHDNWLANATIARLNNALRHLDDGSRLPRFQTWNQKIIYRNPDNFAYDVPNGFRLNYDGSVYVEPSKWDDKTVVVSGDDCPPDWQRFRVAMSLSVDVAVFSDTTCWGNPEFFNEENVPMGQKPHEYFMWWWLTYGAYPFDMPTGDRLGAVLADSRISVEPLEIKELPRIASAGETMVRYRIYGKWTYVLLRRIAEDQYEYRYWTAYRKQWMPAELCHIAGNKWPELEITEL